jgi:hypothetical protein
MLTNQQAFDQVVTHLAQQGRRAMGPAKWDQSAEVCKYRGPDGTKCAAGVLIPDELYDPEMEGDGILVLLGRYERVRETLSDVRPGLLSALQRAHDSSFAWYGAGAFRSEFAKVVTAFQLDTSVLDNADLSKIGNA